MNKNTLRDCTVLLLLTLFIYVPFLGSLAYDGNEPIRALVAQEMLKTANWIIPLLHGKIYLLKPPLMNWIIAVSGYVFGMINEWTARLPSVLAVFMTSISIYFFTKSWLDREGRLMAAIATLSMAGLISKGRVAEIDSLYVFFVVLSLLVWITGYLKRWRPAVVWILSLSVLGIGFLAKGPAIIAFFYLSIFAYLLVRRRLLFLFSGSHLAGILFFGVVVGIYLMALFQQVGFHEYIHMWIKEFRGVRTSSRHGFLEHFLSFPPKAISAFLPWILFIIPAIAIKDLRDRAKAVLKNEIISFSLIMALANFPVFWLLTGARVRYFLPVAPFVAILIGGFFGMYLNRIKENSETKNAFIKYLKVMLSITVLAGVTAIVYGLTKRQLTPLIILFITLLIFFNILLLFKVRVIQLNTIPIHYALLTGFCLLIYTSFQIVHLEKSPNYSLNIARGIKQIVPGDIDTVYELGYDQFLEITCYLPNRVIQIDKLSELPSPDEEDKVYFIFGSRYLTKQDRVENKHFLEQVEWEEVYSQYYSERKGNIVVGSLK